MSRYEPVHLWHGRWATIDGHDADEGYTDRKGAAVLDHIPTKVL